ncbi:hypothetical protein [Plantibacter sp. ME-Dv--P-122b]|uniref:hypothetical protein n=1 Tax=Plantibacter sp. ME-Dv--P-122b TaxID=3040300 RepID=UPI00254A35CB|nr:hypothetical protein [Plantibacter sp. ME-Dv--P-122b]
MKGKVMFVVGGLTGYVLGTRAGRERYEQIKTQWVKLWNAKPVRAQRGKVEDFAKARISEVPAALWSGVSAVAKVVSQQGSTPGEKLDKAISKTEDTVQDVSETVEDARTASGTSTSSASKPAVRKPAAPKTTAPKPKSGE